MALSDGNRQDIWPQTRIHVKRQLEASMGRSELHHVAVVQAEFLCRLPTCFDPGTPHDRGHRIGQFLKPRQLRRPAVVKCLRWIDVQHEWKLSRITLETPRRRTCSDELNSAHRALLSARRIPP